MALDGQDASSSKLILMNNIIIQCPQILLLFSSKYIHKAPSTTGILIKTVHAQNKVRRKTDSDLNK